MFRSNLKQSLVSKSLNVIEISHGQNKKKAFQREIRDILSEEENLSFVRIL